jgi:very-short-patch-repair endonuclease
MPGELLVALGRLVPEIPRLMHCAEPRLTLLRARRGPAAELDDPRHRLVAVIWSRLPGLREQIVDLLERFAELSQALHPEWCAPAGRPINLLWRARAKALCDVGQSPRVPAPRSEQLLQLALTLGDQVTLLLVVDQVTQSAAGLAALTRTAEWAARATGGRVAILVPSSLKDHPDLRRLSYASMDLDARLDEAADNVAAGTTSGAGSTPDSTVAPAPKPTAEIWPVEGRPHLGSPGEKLLALALDGAKDLRGLFGFNRRVVTATGVHYWVDLLWAEGRLVIEVDGYRYHSDREAFAVDRQRDYALLISGYRVLRLTYDEVRLDMNSVLAKIRSVVAFVERDRGRR